MTSGTTICPPLRLLIDINVKGEKIPALIAVPKHAHMYILNRVTGKPVFGVEERPVPISDVPGERSSLTQPFPLKPPVLARESYKPEDIVTAADTNEEHAKFCRELAERSGGFYNAGPFTPYLFREDGAKPRSTILFPGSIGGVNWGGAAADPRSVMCSSTRRTKPASAGSRRLQQVSGATDIAGTALWDRRHAFSGAREIHGPATSTMPERVHGHVRNRHGAT